MSATSNTHRVCKVCIWEAQLCTSKFRQRNVKPLLNPCKSETRKNLAFVRAGIPVGDRKSVPTKFSSTGSYCTLTLAKTCQEKNHPSRHCWASMATSYPHIHLCDPIRKWWDSFKHGLNISQCHTCSKDTPAYYLKRPSLQDPFLRWHSPCFHKPVSSPSPQIWTLKIFKYIQMDWSDSETCIARHTQLNSSKFAHCVFMPWTYVSYAPSTSNSEGLTQIVSTTTCPTKPHATKLRSSSQASWIWVDSFAKFSCGDKSDMFIVDNFM